ncbi:MAG: DUF2188 domain-containing protein [Ignavibacteriae bacterium]|nr:MAG: DUF2188 domain-containing protein [Ignavibacteriota bacterium]
MAKTKVHVIPSGDKWAVKKEGNIKASAVTDTQADAIKIAIPIAKQEKSSVVIHRPDGSIRDTDSYGDESKVKDTKH